MTIYGQPWFFGMRRLIFLASGKKKTTANRSTAGGKKSSTKRPSAAKSGKNSAEKRKETLARQKRRQEIRKDLILLVVIVAAILLFLALFDRVGSLGKGLAAFEYGIFGTLAYVFPFFILFAAVYLLYKGAEYPAHAFGKVLLAFVMLTVVAGIFELGGGMGGSLLPGLASYYKRGRTAQPSGGLFGGLWNRLLLVPLGRTGTWIVLIALLMGLLMLLFGKALLTALGRKGSKVVTSIREENSRYRTAAEERRLNAELRLEERERVKAEERAARLKAEEEERQAVMAKLAAQQEEKRKAQEAAAKLQPVKLNEVQRKADTPVSPSLRKEQESWLKTQAEDRLRARAKEEADRKYGAQGFGRQPEERDDQGILSSGSPLGELMNEMDESSGVRKDTRTIREIRELDAKAAGAGSAKRELYSDDIVMAGRDNMQASEYKATGRIAQGYGDRMQGKTASGSGENVPAQTARDSKPAAVKPDLRINQYVQPGGERAFGETEDVSGRPEAAKPAAKPAQSTPAPEKQTRDTLIPPASAEKPIIATGRPEGDDYEDPREVSERLRQAGKDTVATKTDSIWNTDKERSGSGSASFSPEGKVPSAGKGVAVAGKGVAAAGKTISSAASAGASGAAALPAKPLPHKEYKLPPTSLLNRGKASAGMKESDLRRTAKVLEDTLNEFGVAATVTDVSCGPSVTRYELKPEQGVRVNRIASLADDIKLALAVTDVRIEAPIPGKSAVGIEVPNSENQTVFLRNVIESEEFRRMTSKIAFAVGQDIGGQIMVTDMAKMPHLLIAGSTGSGKSVCINSIIMSLLYRAKPDEVQLIMIDPKVVELGVYNGIPHLRIPVVTDPKLAADALSGAVKEMTRRYKLFADLNVRDIKSYNAKIRENPEEYEELETLPQIVIIVDEFADLMMVAASDVEQSICRLAQLARAAGMHLVLATQRPSANVITGLIKANVQSRIAFAVSSSLDSRIILDMNGAEKLLGKGDMLFYPTGYPKPVRVQGCFVSDEEIAAVTDFWKKQGGVSQEEMARQSRSWMNDPVEREHPVEDERDELFIKAADYIIDSEKASIGNLQRIFRIGFNRAARLMDQLAEAGIVGRDNGTKSRDIMMDKVQLADWKHENGYD